jgi:hypothetical protein
VCTGEERTCERFLWWPLTLDGETRWLEWADVVERYDLGWTPVRFANL